MPLPLEGIRVLEIGDFLPTAFCCMQLGDFGAEVIRVQAPPRAARGRRAEQAARVPHAPVLGVGAALQHLHTLARDPRVLES